MTMCLTPLGWQCATIGLPSPGVDRCCPYKLIESVFRV
jgi:hypothetical protein